MNGKRSWRDNAFVERIISELRAVQASLLLDQNNNMQYLLSSQGN